MKPAAIPSNETERLQAVARAELLDTHSEREFDEFTQLASVICGTPIALISIVDGERQWFKSRVGLTATETPRDISFCGHTIESDALFEVPDTFADLRFHDNPLVTGEPNIRFYAGIALVNHDGLRLGTLCVIDRVPRLLSDSQRASLQVLGRQVSRQIESRLTARALAASVDEVKAVQQALRHSQAFLHTLVDVLAVAVYSKRVVAGEPSRFILWNKAAETITGFPAADVIGRTDREIFSPKMADEHEESDRRMVAQPATTEIPLHRFTCKDGTSRLVCTITVPMFDVDGRIEYILGISQDVTQSTQQQRELRARQAELIAVNDASPLGVFRTDAAGSCTYVNRKFQEITGLYEAQALGDGWISALHTDDRERVLTARAKAIVDAAEYSDVRRFVRPDGMVVKCRVMTAPVVVDGILNGFAGTVDDITERHRVRDALIDSERRLRRITDNVPALISYIDADQRFRFANESYRTLLGCDPATMIGRTVEEIFGPLAYQRRRSYIEAVFQGERVSFESIVAEPDALRYLQVEYVPEFDAQRNVCGFYSLSIDITARRLIEQRLAASENRLTAIADNLPAYIAHVDTNERYLFANAVLRDAFNLAPDAIIGRSMQQIQTPAVYAAIRPYIARALRGEIVSFDSEMASPSGLRHFHGTYVPERNAHGTVTGFYAMVSEITERKNSELRQAENEQRLRTITDNLPVLITYIDGDRRIRFSNAMMHTWIGQTPQQAQGRLLEEVVGTRMYQRRLDYMNRALSGERVEFEMESPDDGPVQHAESIYLPDRDQDGKVIGFYTLTTDITARKVAEGKLLQLARFDYLTGLPNRYQLTERLVQAVARADRSALAVAVMFLDIDHFKQINDRCGHATGDAVLVEFSRRLELCVRQTDMVARLAGDEFIIVLENLHSADEPRLVAQKIIDAVRQPWLAVDPALQPRTSIGVAYRHASNLTADDLMAISDKALYEAKRAGRDGFIVASQGK